GRCRCRPDLRRAARAGGLGSHRPGEGDLARDRLRTVIELYAITDHPRPPLPGVVPLRAVSTRALTAVCAPASESEVTADSLWGYERVVEALMDECDLLPVRYGTRLPDEAAVAAVLEAQYDQLRQSLDFVRGGVEVSVRVA